MPILLNHTFLAQCYRTASSQSPFHFPSSRHLLQCWQCLFLHLLFVVFFPIVVSLNISKYFHCLIVSISSNLLLHFLSLPYFLNTITIDFFLNILFKPVQNCLYLALRLANTSDHLLHWLPYCSPMWHLPYWHPSLYVKSLFLFSSFSYKFCYHLLVVAYLISFSLSCSLLKIVVSNVDMPTCLNILNRFH